MKDFLKWFTDQWRIKSDWPPFTYLFFGIFGAFELLSQVVNGREFPWALVSAIAFYVLIVCPIGYFKRNDP